VSNGGYPVFQLPHKLLWKYRYSKPPGDIGGVEYENCDIEDVWDEKNFL